MTLDDLISELETLKAKNPEKGFYDVWISTFNPGDLGEIHFDEDDKVLVIKTKN
jgi:hypothetical protein